MRAKPQNVSQMHDFKDLVEVMRRLRDPDGGCPWDLAQNFKTIIAYTIEEAYEVADAVDRNDMNDLREELGDLLLQSVYHAQMAAELGHFTIQDVIHDITAKMISRHPHVFADGEAQSAEDVNEIWDRKKDQEKDKESVLDGVAAALPALLWSQKLQKRAGKVGFEWKNPEDILDKLDEELKELREAHEKGTLEDKAEELGDVFFVMANLARQMDINAEEALRQCGNKFIRRFRGLEDDIKAKNKDITASSLAEMSALWDEQKRKEKS